MDTGKPSFDFLFMMLLFEIRNLWFPKKYSTMRMNFILIRYSSLGLTFMVKKLTKFM